jgi:hypothetical protein
MFTNSIGAALRLLVVQKRVRHAYRGMCETALCTLVAEIQIRKLPEHSRARTSGVDCRRCYGARGTPHML